MLSPQLLVLGAGLGAISVVGVLVSKPIVAMIPKKWFNRMQYWLTAYAGAIPTRLPTAAAAWPRRSCDSPLVFLCMADICAMWAAWKLLDSGLGWNTAGIPMALIRAFQTNR